MNRWLMILSLACILVAMAGCERRDADQPQEYNPALDASPGAMQVMVDPNVSADQRVLAKAAEDAGVVPPEALVSKPADKGPTVRGKGDTLKKAKDAFKGLFSPRPKAPDREPG